MIKKQIKKRFSFNPYSPFYLKNKYDFLFPKYAFFSRYCFVENLFKSGKMQASEYEVLGKDTKKKHNYFIDFFA